MVDYLINTINQLGIFDGLNVHPDDLKAIWICHECRRVFLFHSDIDDHKGLTGHKMIEKVMMISSTETSA